VNVNISQLELLSRLLDVTSLRHHVIAHNIANVNTPGFHRMDVSFEESLEKQLASNGQPAPGQLKPRVSEDKVSEERADGNNVDIDVEMGRLNKNALLFNAYTQVLASRIATMRSAISGK
jgi:flagellar basal-body rod protein FlgB